VGVSNIKHRKVYRLDQSCQKCGPCLSKPFSKRAKFDNVKDLAAVVSDDVVYGPSKPGLRFCVEATVVSRYDVSCHVFMG